MSRGLEDSFPLKLCKIIRVELVLEGQSASQLCRFKWALRCPYQGFLLNAVATVTCMVGSLVGNQDWWTFFWVQNAGKLTADTGVACRDCHLRGFAKKWDFLKAVKEG